MAGKGSGKWVKIAVAAVALLVIGSVAAVYFSGFLFLLLSKKNPLNVTYLTTYQYWFYYAGIAAVKKRLVLSIFIACAACYLGPLLAYAVAASKRRELHGSARFASPSEVAAAGLNAAKGIIVGRYKGKYLIFGGQQFVLLAAPTRAGKGVGIVIPNLLNFDDSVVVLDIKQENFDITAGFRAKHGQKVYLFNPFAEDMRTHRYNPLGYISDNPHFRNGDILAIGFALWSGHGKDPFFDDQARNLFLGLSLYLCETPELPRTIGELLRQSSGKGRPIKEYLQGLIEDRDGSDRPLSDDCVDALNRFTSTSDNTLASILASFNAPLVIWANPIVDAATSANDFDLRDVRKVRMSVYVGITPDHLAEAAVLVNVLFSQLVNLNTKERPEKNPALKYQCLLLMDEFTSIGKVTIIAKAVSHMAGYNLRLLPIIQSVAQLASVYGQEDARTFITNHALQILYAPREQRDANEYSEMLGYMTVHSKNKSRSQGGKGSGSVSEASGEGAGQKRALLLPQELKEIGRWKEVVILENVKPILCDKIRYFDDPVFMSRLLPAPKVPTLDLDRHLAMVQQRTRVLTPADVDGGIDLAALTVDLSTMPIIADADVSPEAVKGFVADFFKTLGADLDDDEAENTVQVSDAADDAADDNAVGTLPPNAGDDDMAIAMSSDADDGPPRDGLIDLSVLDGPGVEAPSRSGIAESRYAAGRET